ncbi:hypothetical protein ACQJBY_011018 [Aegilops geniculata]
MTGIRAPAPSPVPKTAHPPESKWMHERGGVSDRLETEGTKGEAEAKQPRGAGISEAIRREPLADGSTQPRFQLSPDKTSPHDHIQHRKAQADDSPSLAAKQVEIHVRNKVTQYDIPEGEISKRSYVGLPERKQIKVERSMTMEISNQVTKHDIPEGEISKRSYVVLPENKQIKVERSMSMEISNQVPVILDHYLYILAALLSCLAEIPEIKYCTATVVRLDLQDNEYLLRLICDQEKVDAITTRENANNTLESSTADEIMEPQMADHFDFMDNHGLDQATDASSELADDPPIQLLGRITTVDEHGLDQATDVPSEPANDPPIQLLGRITTVKELLATGLFENEEIVYTQKSGERKKLKGRIDGLFYRCSCHNEVMSASKFEKHAGCTSHNQNDRIMLWGERSLHAIVAYLKFLGSAEEQLAAILEMKKKNEDRKASRDEG